MATEHSDRTRRRRSIGEINKYDFRTESKVLLQEPAGA